MKMNEEAKPNRRLRATREEPAPPEAQGAELQRFRVVKREHPPSP
jgi:hypothetical protein